MQLVSAVLTGLFVAAGYYVAICILDKRYEMGFQRKGRAVRSAAVLIFGAVVLTVTGILGYIRMPQLPFPMYFLTALILWGMSVLAVTDAVRQIIPNRFLTVLLLLWTAVAGVYLIVDTEMGLSLFFQSLGGALAGGIIFLLCYLLSKKQLGAGDVKLAFVMGLYLTGQRIIGAIFYGTLFCCIYSLIQLFRKKLGMKDGVPMVPFLYMGVVVTLFLL